MFDRFYILLNNGRHIYTTSFKRLFCDDVIELVKHERTFDNGKTYIEVKG